MMVLISLIHSLLLKVVQHSWLVRGVWMPFTKVLACGFFTMVGKG